MGNSINSIKIDDALLNTNRKMTGLNLSEMDIASIGLLKDCRRVSDPDKAQIIWDGIKVCINYLINYAVNININASQTVRAQKQIPALPRLSRYMNRNYKLDKETTQRLLDLAVEDNLIKLHKKVGTKGNKAGVEEDAFRLPTDDMLPYERHDWYCFHCHCKLFLMMMIIFTGIFFSRRRGCDVSRLSPGVSSGVH